MVSTRSLYSIAGKMSYGCTVLYGDGMGWDGLTYGAFDAGQTHRRRSTYVVVGSGVYLTVVFWEWRYIALN